MVYLTAHATWKEGRRVAKRTSTGAYVDEGAAERLFRHKVLALLRRRGLLSQERIELLLSWRRSGGRVLQEGAHYLGGVDHAGLDQVLVLVGEGVEALFRLGLPYLGHDHGAPVTRVAGDLPERLLERALRG
jgi:hypothetical protein